MAGFDSQVVFVTVYRKYNRTTAHLTVFDVFFAQFCRVNQYRLMLAAVWAVNAFFVQFHFNTPFKS